ncbi:acetyltransferase [Algibacter lectus]|uniref:Sugar O-acyltransferase (Sialic acid O-acetyltransferase NeuD family) n=1 Tax=Algibacter lectus TaxID=221126 RepID=A0A4R8MI48_9FLAO|nr:acetyltransferase [Algibacter lectus]MWW23663.1 transferase [Algibacter lectus]TDY63656.1 sugar O-acyltransferase (sialic acid O-acetyltransferase NeuD family) [Algibacter lectus]
MQLHSTEKPNIVVIGASGHASVIIDIIERQNEYNIFGLIDSFKPIGSKLFNYEVLGTEDNLPDLIQTNHIIGGIIAIGDNFDRRQMHLKIEALQLSFKYVSAIHPNAIIGKNVSIAEGVSIMPGTVANANASIGAFCILNTSSSLGHDCVMKPFSSLAPGVNVAGHVTIQTCSSIGIGSCVIGGVSIGAHTHVGAGSTVIKDINSFKIAYGNPAQEIRDRQENEGYLNKKKDLSS